MAKCSPARPKASRSRKSQSRSEWLQDLAAKMETWFADLGFPLPAYDIRSGFSSSGKRASNIAESWIKGDGRSYTVFVRPDRFDTMEVAAAIALQLCVIAVGKRDEHGHLFRHLAISIGLKGTKSEASPGALFKEIVSPIIQTIGPLPEPEISSPAETPAKTQSTRMIKAICPECGYLVRVSRKWLDSGGPPHCPQHGAMVPD